MKKKSVEEVIRTAGFRATKPRVALYVHMQKAKRPVSIIEIVDALSDTLDKVTAYRIVEAFTQAGLLRRVDLHRDRTLYEASDAHDHHHVVCEKCDRIEEFTDCEAEWIAHKAFKQVKGFSAITSHSMEFFGLCNACAKAVQ